MTSLPPPVQLSARSLLRKAARFSTTSLAQVQGPFSQNSFDTRIDYSASQTLNFFGRFSLDYFTLSGKGLLGAVGRSWQRPARSRGKFHHPQLQPGERLYQDA